MNLKDAKEIFKTTQNSEKAARNEDKDMVERYKRKVDSYNNSIGHLNEIDGYDCQICKNRGFISYLDENNYEVHKYCECHKTRNMLNEAKKSGLGNILTKYTFDKFEALEDWQINLKNKAKAFCSDDMAKWFFVGGQVGSGKTHICTAICDYYIKAGKLVNYMLWAEVSKKLKAIANDKSYQDLINKYKEVEVLYIDDFFKTKQGETPTNADLNIAFELINHRLINDRMTIISSEKTLDEMIDYDEATMSRIFQSSGIYNINIKKDLKKNYRLK